MFLCLACLHDSDDHCIDDVLALHADFLKVRGLGTSTGGICHRHYRPVLGSGHETHLDVCTDKVCRHYQFFTILECGNLRIGLLKDTYFGSAEPH